MSLADSVVLPSVQERPPDVASGVAAMPAGAVQAGAARMTISMRVNGTTQQVEVEPRLLLVDLLRDTLGLTGTKVGCDTSQCGACTVLLDGRSVTSCTVLAVQADGSDVVTIEGLSQPGQLNTLQEGFWEKHGLQCGFCTPGMIVSLTDLLAHDSQPSEEQIRTWLEGNLCRCTGYQSVVRAVQYAVAKNSSVIRMVADTPGKRFYEQQVKYLLAGDADGLVDANYHDDAAVISADFVIRGREALKEHFRRYLNWVKIKEVKSTDKFVETNDTVLFEATVASNMGTVKVYDAFVLRDGKITYHFTGVK
jgi:carbon-monoxide dehydrogenase small subunit